MLLFYNRNILPLTPKYSNILKIPKTQHIGNRIKLPNKFKAHSKPTITVKYSKQTKKYLET